MGDGIIVIGEINHDLLVQTDFFSNTIQQFAYLLQQNKDIVSTYTQEDYISLLSQDFSSHPKKNVGILTPKRGGNGNNSAELFAAFKIPVALYCALGKNTDWMLSELESLHIETDLVQFKSIPTPITLVFEDPKFTKIIVAPNMKQKMQVELNDHARHRIQETPFLFFTPLGELYTPILQFGHSHQRTIAATIETQKIASIGELYRILIQKIDFLFLSMSDVYLLFDHKSGFNSKLPIKEFIHQIDPELQKCASHRIYTAGSEGAWLFSDNSNPIFFPPIVVPVKNRTGAGDSFAAGFLTALYPHLQQQISWQNSKQDEKVQILTFCGKFASAAAAVRISTGTIPTVELVQELIKKSEKKR